MPSIRSVTMNPPTMLIVPKAIAIVPMTSRLSPAEADHDQPAEHDDAVDRVGIQDISGVWRVVGTFEITSKPTKAAKTKIGDLCGSDS